MSLAKLTDLPKRNIIKLQGLYTLLQNNNGHKYIYIYQELVELIEGQRSIINQQATVIRDLINQAAEQENTINELMKGYIDE